MSSGVNQIASSTDKSYELTALRLIEECKKTNSKEIAFQAVQELEISNYKKGCIIQDLSNYFKT